MLGPVVVAEIGVGRARRQDEDVVIDRAVGKHDPFLGHVDGRGVGQHHRDIRLMAEDPADRRGDVRRTERGGRHLVEQGLEQMVIGAVDDRDAHRGPPQVHARRPGRRSPRQIDDMRRSIGRAHHIILDRRLKDCAIRPPRKQAIRLGRSPAPRLVERERRRVAKHRLDDPPLGLDQVLAGEQARISGHRRLQEPGVRRHLVGRLPADHQLDRQQVFFLPLLAYHRADRDDLLGIESNADIIMRMIERLGGHVSLGGRVEADHDLGRRLGQALAGSNQERHIGPAPRIDFQPDRGERLDLRVGGDPFFLAVAHVLAADDAGWFQRADRPQHLDFLVADSVRRIAAGRLHRQHGDDLEHVVLDHVADRAGFFVEAAATLHAERFGHRDLHALDAIAVPDRLEELVGEPERKDIENGFLAQIVVDPKDPRFLKGLEEYAIQLAGRLFVVTERLLDHDPRVVGAAGLGQVFHDDAEQARRDRQVVQGARRAFEGLPQLFEGRQIVVIAVDVPEQFDELGERGLDRRRRASRDYREPGPETARVSSRPWPPRRRARRDDRAESSVWIAGKTFL